MPQSSSATAASSSLFGNKYPNNPANLDARIHEEARLKYFSNYVQDKELTNRRVDFWERNKPQYSLSRLVMSRYPLLSTRLDYNKNVQERRAKLLDLQQSEKQQYQIELLSKKA